MIQTLYRLFEDLKIAAARLIITDYNTGAGYILIGKDTVMVRWGSYREGIRVLEAYLATDHLPGLRD